MRRHVRRVTMWTDVEKSTKLHLHLIECGIAPLGLVPLRKLQPPGRPQAHGSGTLRGGRDTAATGDTRAPGLRKSSGAGGTTTVAGCQKACQRRLAEMP